MTPTLPPLADVLDLMPDAVCVVDVDGRFLFVNASFQRIFGYAPDEVLGRDMHELAHHTHADGRHYPAAQCPIFNAFRAGVPCRIDSEVLWRRDGTSFAAEYSSYPILDEGVVHGAVVTFVDITARKLHEEQLRTAHELLERRVADRTQALRRAVDQLRELQAHIDRVREDERTRIAREIHDELGSLLVGLKMDVSWLEKRLLEKPNLRCKCQDMRGLIDTAVDNVGRIITDLRPSILDHQGLWATLEWQAQDFADSGELRCLWSMDIAPNLKAPEGPLATAVFRIFQELLSNVARHAHATQVEIRISATPSDITLVVKDNGRGAPPSAFDSTDAYGVMGMRERAAMAGGRFELGTAPLGGLRVMLWLPLATQGQGDFDGECAFAG